MVEGKDNHRSFFVVLKGLWSRIACKGLSVLLAFSYLSLSSRIMRLWHDSSEDRLQIQQQIYHRPKMLKKTILSFLLLSVALSASIACTQYQASKNGNASDCSITRVDAKTISWGARINFNVNFQWSAKSYSSVLADMGSPRLPIPPSKSSCDTKAGSYTKGQSVIVNCTQSFDSIPVGYSNVITAFDGDDYPLGFSTKIPLSQPHLQEQ